MNSVIASLLDIFGRQHQKFLEIKGENGNIKWDFYKTKSLYIQKTKQLKFLKISRFNLTYINEIKHFMMLKNKKKLCIFRRWNRH